MKKIMPLLVFGLFLVPATFAQTRSRVFDNFDTSRGVQVVTPTVKPIVYSKSTAKKADDKKPSTKSKKTMNVDEGMALNSVSSSESSSSSKLLMGSNNGMNGFTTGDTVVDSYIVNSSRRYNVDPLLIYAQMHQESAFKKRATSHKGASGLMQLMPATARRFGVTNIYDPEQNIDAGVKYMRWLLNKFNGDVVLALAGYNAGEGAVMKYGNNVPPYRETREYVRRITGRYQTISNGTYLLKVQKTKTNEKQVASKIEKEEIKPLTVYETEILTVKLPDGRMRLVSQ